MPGPAPVIIELVGDHHTHEPEGRSVYCKGTVSAMNTNCLATHGHKVGTNMLTTTIHEQIGNQSPQVNLLTGNPVASISHVEYQTAIHKYLHVPVI